MDSFFLRISKYISILFHPLAMPVWGLIIIFNTGSYISFIPYEGKKLIFIIVFSGMFAAPLCFVPLYYYFKVIRNIEMDDPSQRFLPLLITFILFLGTWYIMRNFQLPFINSFLLGAALLVLLNLAIITQWKISSHLIGIGGIIGLMFALSIRLHAYVGIFLIAGILIAGLTASARLRLGAHSPAQIYSGFFLGITGMFIFLIIT
jgi:membrane-associated HD superfamily phosphohydrolase